jgi:small subunit ribosomal protein S6
LNQYEIAVLYDPDLEVDMDKATARVEKIFIDNGGKVVENDNWGKRKLMYTIKKHDSAIYVIYTVELPGENVRKVESTLNITDEVIRFLITRPDLKAIAKADAAKAEKAERAAARGESNDDRDDRDDRDSDKDEE